jgi:hypothetical protein
MTDVIILNGGEYRPAVRYKFQITAVGPKVVK